jgi:hypothetical protein
MRLPHGPISFPKAWWGWRDPWASPSPWLPVAHAPKQNYLILHKWPFNNWASRFNYKKIIFLFNRDTGTPDADESVFFAAVIRLDAESDLQDTAYTGIGRIPVSSYFCDNNRDNSVVSFKNMLNLFSLKIIHCYVKTIQYRYQYYWGENWHQYRYVTYRCA